MLYYLPNEQTIQATGIKPDFEIKPKIYPEEELKIQKELIGRESTTKHHITRKDVDKIDGDKQKKASEKLQKPVQILTKEETWREKREKNLREDHLIQSTLSMINVLHLAKEHAPQMVKTRENITNLLEKLFITEKDMALEKIKVTN